ncbi:vWA domain-containing protein [Nocardia bhagyanarayanae]|uniref:von Willebrand factor type A domain-containing protein n=1 Tax=Nocardia bhagyanarayanae TaxID=1215925 RepID=A0A543FGX4_9NOCA|nr:VWA domain-containing protein [Nocardia bhagyanarayanae]TQM33041.1 von Willebrand factor type A domain-containing protein [Nocardia bhagyanarayanae]
MNSVAGNGISVVVDQNEYLAEGAGTVDAVVSVETGADFVAAGPPPERVEILIIDSSGSMGNGKKLEGARRAAMAALDALPDGTRFAIVQGTSMARLVFPTDEPSVPADATTRAAARRKLDKLRADGGTAMGTWLGLARQLAKKHEGAMVHAILLTDGKNEHESPESLAAEIAQSEGVFTCDCRGVGTDWRVDELRAIASALHGTVDIVADPAHLAADFAAMTHTSMAKAIPELTLRVWTPAGATVRFVKQVAPAIEDLTARRVESGPQVGEYPLGAWGAEERDYHVQVRVEPAAPGREKLAARVSVIAGDEVVGQGLVRAVWTTETELSARISRRVAHYTGQAELADAVQEGLAARKNGDVETATAKLRRAVQLAAESGNESTAKLLRGVVEVDEHNGTVRLRARVAAEDEMALDARSTKTARVRKES